MDAETAYVLGRNYTDRVVNNYRTLLGRVEYNGNREIEVETVDTETNTITSPNHGLENGDRIAITQNNNTLLSELKHLPFNENGTWRTVVNATKNTFQLEQRGVIMEFADNPEIDYSKFHLETPVDSVVTALEVSGFRDSKRLKVVFFCKSHAEGANIFIVLPSSLRSKRGVLWINKGEFNESARLAPSIQRYGHSPFGMFGEVIINKHDNTTEISFDIKRIEIKDGNPMNKLGVKVFRDSLYTVDTLFDDGLMNDIGLHLEGHMLLNGSYMEVYSLD